jgi:hypothetical protein
MQIDYAFNHEIFIEMINSIRDGAKSEEKLYLFMDGAGFHKNDEVKK